MKDTMLKSLYYQTLFLSKEDRNGKIWNTLHNSSDVIDFIDAIIYTLQKTNFFQINDNRMESLIDVLKKIQKRSLLPISFQNIDKEIKKIIAFCRKTIKENKDKNREEMNFSYSVQESKKRNLLYSEFILPSCEESAEYVLKEYPIIASLVKIYELPKEKHKIKDVLSAMSLLISTYKEVLQEDKRIYYYILNYLNALASSLKSIGYRKRLQTIRKQYLALQFSDKDVKLTLSN